MILLREADIIIRELYPLCFKDILWQNKHFEKDKFKFVLGRENMEFRNLKKQYCVLKEEIDKNIADVIESAAFISGPKVKELEEQLADYVGVKHCITCGNGTDALSMIMMAWNIGPGDAVFVPDFTFFASGEVVSFEGGVPIFVDVDSDTFNMDAEKLEEAIVAVKASGKLKPKAVIPVDLFGLPADMEKINDIAKKYGLLVLEDGAQGFGGELNGRKACGLADAGTTSFFPAKPLGCYGDGGAIFTDDDGTAAYLESIRVHGKGSFKYDNVRIGWNSRLDTIQAAVLLPKFKAFKEYEFEAVNKVAVMYMDLLKDIPQIKCPIVPSNMRSSWAQYTIQLESEEIRDGLQKYLKENGVPTMIYYPKPMHEQKAFEDIKDYQVQDCKVTERLCKTVLSLPMDPYKAEEEAETVIHKIKSFMELL